MGWCQRVSKAEEKVRRMWPYWWVAHQWGEGRCCVGRSRPHAFLEVFKAKFGCRTAIISECNQHLRGRVKYEY